MNILPNGQGILHHMSKGKNAEKPHINTMALDLFEITKKKSQAFLHSVDDAVRFEIPILRDLKKRTPLDICLGIDQMNKQSQL
mmetsp:Transcript_6177/g.7391  ORF Transcript_6177/g.7391 Transcript_6177/m.7391 type:complete len:83 (+) Transcript_6177:636-884(+)